MEYIIVPMDRGHIPQIAALERECFSTPWSENMLSDALFDPKASFIVAEDGEGGVLGYAGLQVVLDEGYIDNIAVEEAARRHGVGDALLDVFCRFGQAHLSFLTLEVRASNAPAIALYRKKDERWRERLTAALDAAAEYRFIRTVSVYGTAVLPLLEALDWDGDKAWRKRLMAAVRTQAAFYPHFLEPSLVPGEELTPTELQVLHLLCADKSNAEIAQIMDVKLPTVKTHVSHILDKLDVKRRAEAKTAAKKLHLVPDNL